MGDETTRCHKCGATLRPDEAVWMSGPDGYQPALLWCHPRPDGGGKCRYWSGPPKYAEVVSCVNLMATTLSAAREAPGSA
jgi:hypothetical protein